jgi:CubicO group peptidase (beta-lactamase class C family)
MTAGIKWDESSTAYTDPLNNAASMESSEDWLRYILSLPMENKPGEKFVYNSGITILLSHILFIATDMHVDEYAKKYLFEPLGINNFYWKKTPKGLTDTEGGLYLSSRDFAKIGLLYLQNGQWDNVQILDKDWVTATMSPDTEISESRRKFGFQWWLVPYTGGEENWIYSGSGYGGQFLLIVPEYSLVMVFNGWNIFDKPRPSIEYLSERVLKAIQ